MNTGNYDEKKVSRIAHIEEHLTGAFNVEEDVDYILRNFGNPRACTMELSDHAQASAMYAWFKHNDLNAMRQWCYVASKLDQKWYSMEIDTIEPGARMLQLLKPLLSNHDSLIDWFARCDQAYDMKRVESHKTYDFWAYQAVLALRGEWDRLIERSEKVINDPPTGKSEKKYLIDHHFYLGLARRDMNMMRDALQQIVAPKAVVERRDDDSGYTADMISTAAVIYAKIAWRHDCRIVMDSPYVPNEWLPMDPLVQYSNHYEFLSN